MSPHKKSKIGEAFVLILQIGLAMMVAVGMMAALAIFLNNRFNTIWFMPPLLVLGFAGGVRAAWNLVQGFLKSDGTPERRAYDRIRKLEKERREKPLSEFGLEQKGETEKKEADSSKSISEGHKVEVYKRK